MDDDVFDARLADGELRRLITDYCAYLRAGRYATSTVRVYARCVAHFGHWLGTETIALSAVDETTGRRFLAGHLARCDCPPPVRRVVHEHRAALAHLFRILEAAGVITPVPADHIGVEIARFERYMDGTCGLAANTRRQRSQIVTRFLAARFGTGPVMAAAITAADLRRFALGADQIRSPGTVRVIAGALRCYLRFREIEGDPVGDLRASIPGAAHWRLATLPAVLSSAQVDDLLSAFSGPIPSLRRAYAMVRCLADLGLRACEVARLHLDDIDWRAGTLRLARGKSRRDDILPLPTQTGRAIVDYLTLERPTTANRAVFVRHVAPYDVPIGVGVVRRAVMEAYRRCGWTGVRVHALRHSIASRLLLKGTPLKEIADILRHRSLDTTAIYAKVDTKRLAAVALPWPGDAS
jgi:integrase/recombinase XerD